MQYLCVIKQFSFAKIAVCCILGDLLFAKVELELSPPTLQYSNYISVQENQLLDFIENLKKCQQTPLFDQYKLPQTISPATKCFSKANLSSSIFFQEKGKLLPSYYKANFQIFPPHNVLSFRLNQLKNEIVCYGTRVRSLATLVTNSLTI